MAARRTRKPTRPKSRKKARKVVRRVKRIAKRKAPVRDAAVLDLTFEGNGARGRRVHLVKFDGAGNVADSNTIDQDRPFFRPRVAADGRAYAEAAVFDFGMEPGDGVSIYHSAATGGTPRHLRSYVVTKDRGLRAKAK